MAANRCGKKAKTAKEALEEILEQSNEFLKKTSKPKKKSHFFIFRDPLTGKRSSKHPYKPRFQKKNPADQPSTSASDSNSAVDDYLALDGGDQVGDDPFYSDLEEDTLEATLAKCDNFLSSFGVPASSKNWETRMMNLTSSWDSSRKQLFEAFLAFKSPPSPNCCNLCCKGKVQVRCAECPVKFMCSSCDEKVHQGLLFHNRDAFVNGYFNAIPPTVVIDEKGNMQTTAKFYPLVNLPTHCSKCKEEGVLQEMPLSGSLIIVNEKGRFDFNKYAVHCRNCNDVTPSWTIRDVVQTGYWPGSPSETSYVFDQQLFRLWDSLQKRMPGTSESSFIRALEDVSAMSGRSATINPTTFSRSFKEWKFCQHEIQQLEGMNWMKCPICSVSQHSCHVDGNMKLYRYHSSGSQRRPSYYGDLFIANKDDVDTHIKNAYAKQPKLKVGDNRCGDSHWRAANNSGRKSAKLDETGLEIAGCRHGLAQWAVNMFQGELFGYANYIHLKKMIPSGVKYFWEDIVCKYWKWARKAGGLDGSNMKPALSVMHAKAHNWTCQVIWGGRWQVGSACSTGEEVEQINSHMSRCGNTTKYMLPENREELITEHVLSWNKRKIFDLVQSLEKRYTRAIKMQNESEKDFIDILGVYNVPLEQFKADEWKNIVISHAQEVEAARAIQYLVVCGYRTR
ncbi:uncharacterized protein LOC114951222 isoform X3 [Acropora millepora]|uniref:uncharacterized protein LOC114951222 isoform X3 n=1 Tax=Acropora millepora TaxID=45264 RepID=UPI001CF0EF94|nr:uncharacterized protein LOC114951222 isoform X3 [Acropora millepora]